MNPLTNVRNVNKLNERELDLGIEDPNLSWHSEYKDSSFIFIGGIPYELTEGDVICIFSQFGEVVFIHMVRDRKTGKSKGFCFLAYEDQRSTVLAVDNLNGIKVGGRTIRVDHVKNFKPATLDEKDESGQWKLAPVKSCAPSVSAEMIADQLMKEVFSIPAEDLPKADEFAVPAAKKHRAQSPDCDRSEQSSSPERRQKKHKKHKSKDKKKKRSSTELSRRDRSSDSSWTPSVERTTIRHR